MNDWINNKLLPPIMKFVNTKAITALKNGMLVSLPFIMVGSVFLLLSSFPLPAVANWMNATGLTPYWTQAYNASFGVLAIFAVVGIAYNWVKDDGFEPLPAGMTALVSFFLVMRPSTPVLNAAGKTVISATQAPTMLGGFIDRTWLGGQGMIAAIIIGLLTGWAYSWFLKHHITIKLPEQVPPAVSDSFVALIPAFVIVTGWLLVYILFDVTAHTTMTQWIYQVVQTPLQGMTDSFGGVVVIALLIPFFWFFGVHGAVIVGGIMGPILQANALQNAAIFKAHGVVTAANGGHIFIQSLLDQFGTVTGSGMTIGLVVFMAFFAKSAQMKSIGRLSFVPGLFNINEPVLFGVPVVMNPLLIVPFMAMPLISMGSTYLLIKVGFLPYLNGVYIPWTTPPIISGLLVGGWKMMIWQAFVLVLSFFVYLPFARKQDQMLLAQENAAEDSEAHTKEANAATTTEHATD
ncbi:PTS cellobiose transporter subunit IIC [Pediococcus damnosus LMG 28219]|uniref:PTS sugar transporter subunit IIC n=1 Tax=Pediococcus damnosus TaxID=51663 RepID=UPI00061EFF40|nr:PTS sugar transporter subunit IIC [Pediococcus damnosus]KJU74809.1 PTS cellobiose transporter subunit IIC [Pediococcus damnosus LMG 28219]